MGYQESFIYFGVNTEKNNDYIEKTLELFKKLDVRMADDYLASCVAKLTFKEDKYPWPMFDKGMQVLWIAGERQCQRNPFRLFDIYEDQEDNPNMKLLTKADKDLIKRINIIFLDYFDSDIIRKVVGEDSPYTDLEKLHLLPESPKKIETIEMFAEKLRGKLEIENDFDGSIFAVNDHKSLEQTLSDICKEMNLPLEIDEGINGHLNVPNFSYYLNGVYFANYHDTPHLSKKGTWHIQLGGQKLRALARAIDGHDPSGQKGVL